MTVKLLTAGICLIYLFKNRRQAVKMTSKRALVSCSGYAVFTTVGNLLLLITLKHIPASVQYPAVTGGVMLVSLLISVARKEKITKKDIISTVIAFASTVMIALQV